MDQVNGSASIVLCVGFVSNEAATAIIGLGGTVYSASSIPSIIVVTLPLDAGVYHSSPTRALIEMPTDRGNSLYLSYDRAVSVPDAMLDVRHPS